MKLKHLLNAALAVTALMPLSCSSHSSKPCWRDMTIEQKLELMRADTGRIRKLDSLAQTALGPGAKCLDAVKHLFSPVSCRAFRGIRISQGDGRPLPVRPLRTESCHYDRSQVYKIGRIKYTNTMKNEEIRQNIISLLRSTGRQGIEATIAYLERSNYFRARCHSHHRHFGGLARHSLEACGYALANAGDIPAGSVIIATLLHDVCTSKAHDTDWIQGHGRRSVQILETICGLDLNRDEREAILLHMHGGAPQMKTNRLAALVNRADHVSAGGHWRLRESA